MTEFFIFGSYMCLFFLLVSLNVENLWEWGRIRHFSDFFFFTYLVVFIGKYWKMQAIATCGKGLTVFVETFNGCCSHSCVDSARQINKLPRRIDGLCHLVSFYKAVIQHINLLLPVDCFGKPPIGSYLWAFQRTQTGWEDSANKLL